MEPENVALDRHGADWRDWILNNLAKNCAPLGMFEKMVAGVWERDIAAQALDEGLRQLGVNKTWRKPLPGIRTPTQVCNGAGYPVRVLCQIAVPHALLLDGVLSESECDQLIEYAYSKGLKRSGVVDGDSGNSQEHHARTSSSVFFTRSETPLIDEIEQRLAALTHWPIENGEGLQLLQYEPGQEYKAHFDWFNPKNPGSASHLKRGGQRVGTLVVYLQTPSAGGGTRFPKSGIEVMPNKGGAIFFTDLTLSGQPDENTLHAGTPVQQGTKIVLTYWQREASFQG